MISMEDMKKMNVQELHDYLIQIKIDKKMLMQFMMEHDIPFRPYESKKKMFKHFAREVTGLGVFERIVRSKSGQ